MADPGGAEHEPREPSVAAVKRRPDSSDSRHHSDTAALSDAIHGRSSSGAMNSLVFGQRAVDMRIVDRWAYVGIAGMLFLVALMGFAPRSVAILSGQRANPPLVVHVHAATMALWMTLLLAQSLLMATGRRALHKTLGIASLVLAPALVGTMIAVAIWRYGDRVQLGQAEQGANTLMSQGRAILYFSLFYVWAIAVRRRDPDTHKRMLILATLVLVPAAIARMTILPTTMPQSYDALHLYMLLLLAPAVLYDVVRTGRPHRAYLIGLALLLPWMIAMRMLWSSPWWLETAPRLMAAVSQVNTG